MISEINVTPMVDVMLVLLIIFMVAAPLLTVVDPGRSSRGQGAGHDQAEDRAIDRHRPEGERLVQHHHRILPGRQPDRFRELEAKIKAIKESGEKEIDPNVNLRGDKEICYSDVMRLLGRIKAAGFGANIEVIPEQEKR